jgi:hypothetical protein
MPSLKAEEVLPGGHDKIIFQLRGLDSMVTREEIIAEIQKVPEKHLDELYKVIKDFEVNGEEEEESGQSVMAKLRRIKISAPPDFSTKANLYDIEE